MCKDWRRCYLIAVSIANFLAGVALITIGFIFLNNKSVDGFDGALPPDGANYTQSRVLVTSVSLFAGAVFVISSFLGCYGAYHPKGKPMIAYVGVLFLIIGLQVVLFVLAFARRDEVPADAQAQAFRGLALTNDTVDTTVRRGWDQLQLHLRCCGVQGADDWRNTPGTPYYGNTVRPLWPDSCCLYEYTHGCAALNTSRPFEPGCFTSVSDDLEFFSYAIGTEAILFFFLTTFAIYVANPLRKDSPNGTPGDATRVMPDLKIYCNNCFCLSVIRNLSIQ